MPDDPSLPRIAITAGDPLGIGPEIVAKALARQDVRSVARFDVFGPSSALDDAAGRAGIVPPWAASPETVTLHATPVAEPLPALRTHSSVGGAVSLRSLEDAIAHVKQGHADAIVTAPISKTSWELAGMREFPGHTELLAARFHAPRSAMLFVGTTLRVILVTIHVPLARVPSLITRHRVLNAIELGAQACVDLGVRAPRIAVCGLNPHAGEGGILGHEDDLHIRPAVEEARAHGIDATGPLPADAAFPAAARARYDLVVAMYHDQGLAPIKLLEQDQTVNVTVGLPGVARTSPAHGTAFDIAGKNLAREDSMAAAIRLAARMARHRRA
jgi:4-hydroxythreonine-4-phosphate dehydrogenase